MVLCCFVEAVDHRNLRRNLAITGFRCYNKNECRKYNSGSGNYNYYNSCVGQCANGDSSKSGTPEGYYGYPCVVENCCDFPKSFDTPNPYLQAIELNAAADHAYPLALLTTANYANNP